MRRVILYIAASLDGYIAGENGGVDWLDREAAPDEAGNGYEAFLREIDTIVMGYNTYRQVTEELSPGKWVYAGKKTCVLTHRGIANLPEIQFVCQPAERLIETLQQEDGKGIWICGGAKIIHPLLQQNLIDEFRITIIPILLGRGIPLFGALDCRIPLQLISTQKNCNLLELLYRRCDRDKEEK